MMDFSPYFDRMAKFVKPPTIAVIHHTGDASDIPIEEYNRDHIARGFVCFGAHALCRKSVDTATGLAIIQYGRPVTDPRTGGLGFIGAHAYGVNSISVGVETCGNYLVEDPPMEQINALALLVEEWVRKFPSIHAVIGHCDVSSIVKSVNGLSTATACPGNKLYARIPQICWLVNNKLGIALRDPYNHQKEILDKVALAYPDGIGDEHLFERGLYHA